MSDSNKYYIAYDKYIVVQSYIQQYSPVTHYVAPFESKQK